MRNRKRQYRARQKNKNHHSTTDWMCWKSSSLNRDDQTNDKATRSSKKQSSSTSYLVGNGDVPSLFACCGVGLLFGDASDRDGEYYKRHANQMYEEQVQQQNETEEKLRNQYTKVLKEKFIYHPNQKQEAYEMVE